jgi:hypothetical protein
MTLLSSMKSDLPSKRSVTARNEVSGRFVISKRVEIGLTLSFPDSSRQCNRDRSILFLGGERREAKFMT